MNRRTLARLAGLTAAPWIIVFGGTLAYWPLFYYLAPVFLPTLCHQREPDDTWPVFAKPPWWYLLASLYTFLVALAAVFLSRGQRPVASAAISVGVALVAAAVAHLSLSVLGFGFYMDAP
jgi:hypothetical protein